MFLDIAYAQTGTGIETALNNLVALILAICGLTAVGGIGFKGLQFVIAQDWRHAGESLIGVGIGCGLIAFARAIGTFIMSAALGASLTPLAPLTNSEAWSDLLSVLFYYLPLMVTAWRAVRKAQHHG